jgi:flavodoxin
LKDEHNQKLFDALKHLNVVIAGGYCLTKVQALHGNFLSKASDIDVFCVDDNTYQKTVEAADKIAHITFESEAAVTYRINHDDPGPEVDASTIFQLIKPTKNGKQLYKNFTELIEDFDLNNSKYWSISPFDTIYTKQDNRKLFEISCSKKEWNYHFVGRILKYHNQKHLVLPYDNNFIHDVVEIAKRKNQSVFKLERSNYNKIDTEMKKYLQNALFNMISLVYKKRHPAAVKISREITSGNSEYLHLEEIFQENIHNAVSFGEHSNFLFDYWLQENYHKEIQEEFELISGVGPRLENVDFFKRNTKKVKELFPELLL